MIYYEEPKILLTFDVEEFDLPLEYGIAITPEEQMEVGKKGLDVLSSEVLSKKELSCTLFTTAHFAETFPEAIRSLSKNHEIASHSYYHSSFDPSDVQQSRETLERITGKKVFGLRMPRMKKIDTSLVKNAGYFYESSMNPTWIPGRYNHFRKPRILYIDDGMLQVPVSVSPNLRIPLFWLAFKNFPYALYLKIALHTLKHDGYLSLYFHPWEFTPLEKYALPAMVKRSSGKVLMDKLNKLIDDLAIHGKFVSMNHFIRN